MAFLSNHIQSGEKKEQIVNSTVNNPISTNELDRVEIEYLLRILGNADLKGKEVEMFYNLVIKLQQQHINKQ